MRLATGLAAATLAAFTLTGCAGSDDTATSPAPATASATSATPDQTPDATRSAASAPAQPDGPTLQITLDGDQLAWNGQRFEVSVGEPLLLRFTTDRAGELHVHSKPEHVVDFPTGKSSQELVIETPGSSRSRTMRPVSCWHSSR
jgi:hypothetical protein